MICRHLFAIIFAKELWVFLAQIFQRLPALLECHFPPLSLLHAREFSPGISRAGKNENANRKRKKSRAKIYFNHLCIDA